MGQRFKRILGGVTLTLFLNFSAVADDDVPILGLDTPLDYRSQLIECINAGQKLRNQRDQCRVDLEIERTSEISKGTVFLTILGVMVVAFPIGFFLGRLSK